MTDFVYETMYILRPDLAEDGVEQAIAKYENLLREHGAETVESQNLGKKRLAQPLKKQRDGIYVQLNYKCPGNKIAVLERAMRISEDVIRYLTIKQEVSAKAAEAVEAEA